MDFTLVLALAAGVERFVEAVKPLIASLKLSDETYKAVVQIVGVLIGMGLALLSQDTINLFTGYPQIPTLVGTLLTGAIAGIGSAAVHVVIDLFYGWRDKVMPPVVG